MKIFGKDKNKWGSENALLPRKSGLKTKSKILVLGLAIVIVLVGLFGSLKKVNAQTHTDPEGTCTVTGPREKDFRVQHDRKKSECPEGEINLPNNQIIITVFEEYSGTNLDPTPSTIDKTTTHVALKDPTAQNNPNESEFENAMQSRSCISLTGFDIAWCFVRVAYVLFYAFPAFLLWASAHFFNVLISITLSSRLFADSTFIPPAWAIVRDLSNIFFILILLYIAIKIILDIGGSEAKKMIAKVIITALLINFSMFMTEVVIDTSNITALIFYNKINVCTNRNAETEACKKYDSVTGEKDVAGGLVSKFDPTKALNEDFFKKAGEQTVPGLAKPIEGEVPAGIMFGIIIITGLLMFFAAYALFVSGFCFLGRLIELWILIIFSPFAFMSFSIPLLGKIEYIGWKEWSSNLIKVSFMAPIFMFFLYFIFKLAKLNVFNGLIKKTEPTSLIESLLLIILPTLMILILLKKAVKYAEKGGGIAADFMGSVGKVVAIGAGGIAGGLAIGAVAKGAQATVGKYSEKFAKSATAKRWIDEGQFGADRLQRIAHSLGGSSFDARKGAVSGVLKSAEKVTGINFGSASKILLKPDGGYRERAEKKRQERVNKLKVSEDEPLKQELNKKEEEFYEMNNASSHEIEQIETRLTTAVKNRETYRLEQEAVKGKLNTTKSSLDTFGEEKAKAALDKATSTHKTAQDEAGAARKAADQAKSTAITDAEKNAAANAEIIAITKEEIAAKADKTRVDADADYGAIISNPDYIKAKANYDTAEKDYNKAVDDFKIRTQKVKELTDHRSAIKNAKAGNRSVADTGADLKKAESDLSAAEKSVEKAKAMLVTAAVGTPEEAKAKKYLKIATEVEESMKQVKELANAVHASAQYGQGESINEYEDKILPKLREAVEDENRKRSINYAKRNIRGSDNGIINALRTMVTTAGDDQASRNAAAHEIIEKVSKKKV